MLASQKLAIAAHLHVLLRRKTGRVTDTEWMAENIDYAREVVRFARAKALEDGHVELAEWADKLEDAMLAVSPDARRPLVQAAAQLLRSDPLAQSQSRGVVAASDPRNSGFGDSQPAGQRKPADAGPRYVGGIR